MPVLQKSRFVQGSILANGLTGMRRWFVWTG
jgi:hypothetical protein